MIKIVSFSITPKIEHPPIHVFHLILIHLLRPTFHLISLQFSEEQRENSTVYPTIFLNVKIKKIILLFKVN